MIYHYIILYIWITNNISYKAILPLFSHYSVTVYRDVYLGDIWWKPKNINSAKQLTYYILMKFP